MTLHVSKQSRGSLFVISTIIVTDIYVHSLVELKIILKMHCTTITVKHVYVSKFVRFQQLYTGFCKVVLLLKFDHVYLLVIYFPRCCT